MILVGAAGEEEEEEGVQVITLVTLNLWVWGFRVQPIWQVLPLAPR